MENLQIRGIEENVAFYNVIKVNYAAPSKTYRLTAGKAVADEISEVSQEGPCVLGVDVQWW